MPSTAMPSWARSLRYFVLEITWFNWNLLGQIAQFGKVRRRPGEVEDLLGQFELPAQWKGHTHQGTAYFINFWLLRKIKELVLARDIIEMGALYSIASRDIPAFSRYIAQLKSYYFDYQNLPKSDFRSQLLGLNLLW